MGLLDDLAGKALGNTGTEGNLVNALMGLLGDQKSGGLAGLVRQFSEKGLGDAVNSWVGTGQNMPVTPQQIRQGLGADAVGELASKAGISQDQATSQLSELLPKLVDKLTPDGKIPQGDIMSKGMDILKGLMK
jgi:uncharacterized protein YidB (DUF937 family)